MSLAYLQLLHSYLIIACQNPGPDEDVHQLRLQRRQVAELIAFYPHGHSDRAVVRIDPMSE